MIRHMNLEAQADSDFVSARRQALLRRVWARFHKDPTHNWLLPFDEVRKASLADNQTRRGTGIVEAWKIEGSMGRQSDFEQSFLRARASVEARWKRVDRAFYRMRDLPPVSLYKIGDGYFALDGHHRVSVARYHDVTTVEAVVTEFRPRTPSVSSAGAQTSTGERTFEAQERGAA